MGTYEERRQVSEAFADPDSEHYWRSVLRNPDALETLVTLPEQYDDVGDGYRIADDGCGDATLITGTDDVDGLADAYPAAEITGFDYATGPQEEQAADYDNVRFVAGDMFETVPDEPAMDWRYGVHVVHATDDPYDTVELLADNMVDGGYAALVIPGDPFIEIYPDASLSHDDDLDLPVFSGRKEIDGEQYEIEQYLIPEKDVEKMINAAGLEIVETDTLLPNEEDIASLRAILGADEDDASFPDPEVNLYVLQK